MACAVAIVVGAATRPANAGCTCAEDVAASPSAAHMATAMPVGPGDIVNADIGGTWYWMRSPEQERRVVMSLFNRYCIRCHGVDGRGVWDIPDVPDFTNAVWQATRPDDYRSRVILEGRGAVMPAFRGTLTLEEACAMARYLHTFAPGNEISRPGLGPAVGHSTRRRLAASRPARRRSQPRPAPTQTLQVRLPGEADPSPVASDGSARRPVPRSPRDGDGTLPGAIPFAISRDLNTTGNPICVNP